MTTTKAPKNNHAPVKEHGGRENGKEHMAGKDRPKKAESSPKNENEVILANTLGQIEKTFGKGSIMKLTEATSPAIQGISSGALSLDIALGGKDFPAGGSSSCSAPNQAARPPSPCTPSAVPSAREGLRPSLTPNTRSIRRGPSGSA
jgi:hypothetical protein